MKKLAILIPFAFLIYACDKTQMSKTQTDAGSKTGIVDKVGSASPDNGSIILQDQGQQNTIGPKPDDPLKDPNKK